MATADLRINLDAKAVAGEVDKVVAREVGKLRDVLVELRKRHTRQIECTNCGTTSDYCECGDDWPCPETVVIDTALGDGEYANYYDDQGMPDGH